MKLYKTFFITTILLAVFNFSCSKDEKNEVPEIVEEPPVPQETFAKGKILKKKADLCLLGRDSQMHPVIKLSCGDDISLLELDGIIDEKFLPDSQAETSQPEKKEGNPVVSENLTENEAVASEILEVSGKKFVHIVHDNMDFWLEDSVFALNCENAVAIEKTFMYSDSELTQKIASPQNPLKFATQIAKSTEEIAPEATSENSVENTALNQVEKAKSAKIFFYDTEKQSVSEAFVPESSISTRIDDIVVSQIAEQLKTTKRAAPRNELFSKAAKYKPCKKVLAVLNSQKVETRTYNYQEVLKSMQRMSFGVNVEELMTVDQSKDPFK